MRTVIETPTFQKQAAAVWRAEEREAFIDFIAPEFDTNRCKSLIYIGWP